MLFIECRRNILKTTRHKETKRHLYLDKIVDNWLVFWAVYGLNRMFKPCHATVSFYAPSKHQKTSGMLMFSGGIERD